MNIRTHVLGYPRIGAQREMKKAVEAFWKGKIDQRELQGRGADIREANWRDQQLLDMVCVGDFAWYDHMLNLSLLLGAIPARFRALEPGLEQMFAMARGCTSVQGKIDACEMTKWFNTNYHYLVPELSSDQSFQHSEQPIYQEVQQAQAALYRPKVILPGPLNFLHLAKVDGGGNKLALLPQLQQAYLTIVDTLRERGVDWLQLDEPWLVTAPDSEWQQALLDTYRKLHNRGVKLLVATYFGDVEPVAAALAQLPADGLHLDLVEGDKGLESLLPSLPQSVISLGVVDGRNIWRSDLTALVRRVKQLMPLLRSEELWLGSSCSLLHVPVSLQGEEGGSLGAELQSWLAFAREKCAELLLLRQALQQPEQAEQLLAENRAACARRRQASSSYLPQVRQRCQQVTDKQYRRSTPYSTRIRKQRERLQLPPLPTTTIGSFPQTDELRKARRAWRRGSLDEVAYHQILQQEVRQVVAFQQEVGIDVLVHGEPERNDMVEYFGEQLVGYAFSSNGWVQSYGSRCVKPPIIYGDVHRPQPMTVEWSRFAQSLSRKPMKGMLTGPVTMLHWSFCRDDLPLKDICRQIALALLDEVLDLEKASIKVIQIDEPALREGLPLRRDQWAAALKWAVDNFRLCHAQVADDTQIHTHMCYSEFNDIIEAIVALDADVITIETSRSHNELFASFQQHSYPNDIGPGVYDIHSPNIPQPEEMVAILELALQHIPAERLWVNPDCGLKTRRWEEVRPSLTNMVRAAQQLRQRVGGPVPSL